jgi:hypothetical protein
MAIPREIGGNSGASVGFRRRSKGLDVFCGEARGSAGPSRGHLPERRAADRGQSNQGSKPFLAQQIGHASYSADLVGIS